MNWLTDLFHPEPKSMDEGLEEAVEKNRREAEDSIHVSRSIFDTEANRWRDERTHQIIAEAMNRVVRGH